jgi:glycine/D-amino acid oxidase-like deaminating enzyme
MDRDGPARGSTMASTGLITFELDLPLHRLARRIGVRRAVAAWRDSLAALGQLRQVVQEEQLECAWADRESLYLAGTAYGSRALRTEAVLRAQHGIPGRYLPARELRARYGIERTGAVHARGMAVADPVLLTSALLTRSKAPVYAPVEVLAVRTQRNRVLLETNLGSARARTVVFCTGYALLPSIAVTGLSVDSTWAIATERHASYPAWLDTTIVWEASDPYLYLRSGMDGSLIAGGRDEPSAERHLDVASLPRKAREIAGDVRRLLHAEPLRVDRCWSGAFGTSNSGLPVVGPVPGMPGCHFVAGFGGNGITHAMLAARLLEADLWGRRIPHAGLYRPGTPERRAASVAQ